MKLHFFGATRTTTGSMYLLEVNGARILLECGLYQGKRMESFERNANFPFDPKTLDAVILSHAHIDHSGNLPTLVKKGYQGNIYCTFGTRDLCSIMLEDSAHVQKDDVDYMNKQNARKGLPAVQPLYTETDAEYALRQFIALGYDRPFPVVDGVKATFVDAGHILGSASVVLDIDENGQEKRFLFTGDIGRGNNDILRDPTPVPNVDALMIESTYGGREHESLEHINNELAAIINQAVKQNGKVIIPAFAVGRTQHIVYTLHQLIESKAVPALPVYVDSPLSVNATEIFRMHPECFNQETYEFLRTKRNPFGFDQVTYIRALPQSKALNQNKDSCIIIASSGMCEAGRIRHHLKNNLHDPRNTVLIVGFCAEDTLGHKLVRGDKTVNIFGEPHQVNARIEVMNAFSAHADRSELQDYLKKLSGPLNNIFVVHGQESQALALGDYLQKTYAHSRVLVPHWKDSIEL